MSCNSLPIHDGQYTRGFDWHTYQGEISCDNGLVKPDEFLAGNQEGLRKFLNEQSLLEAAKGVSLVIPSGIGQKEIDGKYYLRFNFAEPLEEPELGFDGGITVTVDVCAAQFVFAGYLVW